MLIIFTYFARSSFLLFLYIIICWSWKGAFAKPRDRIDWMSRSFFFFFSYFFLFIFHFLHSVLLRLSPLHIYYICVYPGCISFILLAGSVNWNLESIDIIPYSMN